VAICRFKETLQSPAVLVAVKFLRDTMLKNRDELALFVKEAALMRKLKNRQVPAFHLAQLRVVCSPI
jgi:hypothetical protein